MKFTLPQPDALHFTHLHWLQMPLKTKILPSYRFPLTIRTLVHIKYKPFTIRHTDKNVCLRSFHQANFLFSVNISDWLPNFHNINNTNPEQYFSYFSFLLSAHKKKQTNEREKCARVRSPLATLNGALEAPKRATIFFSSSGS